MSQESFFDEINGEYGVYPPGREELKTPKEIVPAKIDSHIVITLGYAIQTHWLMVVREYINQEDFSVEYAEVLFSFWEHSFYKKGGIGPVPRRVK